MAWWSTIEINLGLICTCLPTLRPMLVSIAPRVLGSVTGGSRGTPNKPASRAIMVQKQVRISSIDGSFATEAMSQSRVEPWEATAVAPERRARGAEPPPERGLFHLLRLEHAAVMPLPRRAKSAGCKGVNGAVAVVR